jgi:N-acetylglutamate synthase-like GNAT family acetyltransferase
MQNNTIIRKANTKDIDKLILIVQGVTSIEDYPGEFNRNYFKNMLKKNKVLVVEINRIIAGFIEFEWDREAKRVFLHSVAVSKNYRNKGIGSKLLYYIESFARKHKAIRISMLTRTWNTPINILAKRKVLQSLILFMGGRDC